MDIDFANNRIYRIPPNEAKIEVWSVFGDHLAQRDIALPLTDGEPVGLALVGDTVVTSNEIMDKHFIIAYTLDASSSTGVERLWRAERVHDIRLGANRDPVDRSLFPGNGVLMYGHRNIWNVPVMGDPPVAPPERDVVIIASLNATEIGANDVDPTGIAYDSANDLLYVAQNNHIYVYSGLSDTVIITQDRQRDREFDVPDASGGIACSEDRLYVASADNLFAYSHEGALLNKESFPFGDDDVSDVIFNLYGRDVDRDCIELFKQVIPELVFEVPKTEISTLDEDHRKLLNTDDEIAVWLGLATRIHSISKLATVYLAAHMFVLRVEERPLTSEDKISGPSLIDGGSRIVQSETIGKHTVQYLNSQATTASDAFDLSTGLEYFSRTAYGREFLAIEGRVTAGTVLVL